MKHKINVNGVTYEVTEEEAAKYEGSPAELTAPEPTPEERMNEIEAALIELASMLAGGGF